MPREGAAENARGVPAGSSAHTLSNGSWVELPLVRAGRETKITASGRMVGKGLNTRSMRGVPFTEPTLAYVSLEDVLSHPPPTPDPPEAAGPCFCDCRARAGG